MDELTREQLLALVAAAQGLLDRSQPSGMRDDSEIVRWGAWRNQWRRACNDGSSPWLSDSTDPTERLAERGEL